MDEVVLHLREAGAKRIFLDRTDAFRTGTIPIVATYEYSEHPDGESVNAPGREMLVRVFESVGDRVRFDGREWPLEWRVEPAVVEPRNDLVGARGWRSRVTDHPQLPSLFLRSSTRTTNLDHYPRPRTRNSSTNTRNSSTSTATIRLRWG